MNNKESQLVIVEKYEEFINYIYPCIQNIARRHGIVKEEFLKIMFLQVELFYKAIKSDSKVRLKDSVVRAKRKIKRYIKLELWEKLDMFLASWLGHLKSANSFNLINYIKGVIQCYIMLKQKQTLAY